MTDASAVRDEGLVRVIGSGALGLSVVNMVVGAGTENGVRLAISTG